MNFDKELDARGLDCPLPILRTKKALTDMASGQLMSHAEANKEFTFFMRKK